MLRPEQRMLAMAAKLKERADALVRYAGGVEVDDSNMGRILAMSVERIGFANHLARLHTESCGDISIEGLALDVFAEQKGECLCFGTESLADVDAMEELAWTLLAISAKAREELEEGKDTA